MEKSNLTLRIDKEVLEKARKLGLNLSSITESFLKTQSLLDEEDVVTAQKLREAYRSVFIEIVEVLNEWGVSIEIGSYVDETEFKHSDGKKEFRLTEYKINLDSDGRITLWVEYVEEEPIGRWRLNEDWPVNCFYEPTLIISNLIKTLYLRAEENKNKLQQIQLLKNFLQSFKKDSSKVKDKEDKK